MTEEQIQELDAEFPEAADFIRSVMNSPYYESYIALKTMMDVFNGELQTGDITIFNKVTFDENERIGKEDKSFPNIHKYSTSLKEYHEQLDYLRGKLLPEKIRKADEEVAETLQEVRERMKNKKASEVR